MTNIQGEPKNFKYTVYHNMHVIMLEVTIVPVNG